MEKLEVNCFVFSWAARQGNGEFKNSVCSIKFSKPEEILNGAQPPLFGSEFHFTLDQQVSF